MSKDKILIEALEHLCKISSDPDGNKVTVEYLRKRIKIKIAEYNKGNEDVSPTQSNEGMGEPTISPEEWEAREIWGRNNVEGECPVCRRIGGKHFASCPNQKPTEGDTNQDEAWKEVYNSVLEYMESDVSLYKYSMLIDKLKNLFTITRNK
jgi:hypothetical protein